MKTAKIEEDIENYSVISKAVNELVDGRKIKINFLEGKVLFEDGIKKEYKYHVSVRRFRKLFTYLLARQLLLAFTKKNEGSIDVIGVDGYILNTDTGKYFFGLTHKFRGLMEYNEYAVRRFEDGGKTKNN